jgi:zinc/manganese transport system substrate-binding protein
MGRMLTNNRAKWWVLLCTWTFFVAPAYALQGVACEPEWAALGRVLMPQAIWSSATHARQDPHHIEARPALIAQWRQADVLVCTGAALEAGWLPILQERSGNPRVQDGAAGVFYASEGLALLDPQMPTLSPFAGDVHPAGNPHIHGDPRNFLPVARGLADVLTRVTPSEAAAIAQRLQAFERDWARRVLMWERQAAPLKGRTVVAQHGTFAYLWRWLGMTQVADLEPKPGMAPTPGHLERLRQRFRADPPYAIVVAAHHDPRPARWLASQLQGSVPVVVLPATVPDPVAPDALGQWVESVLAALLMQGRP